jgi:hypothetical protein
MIISFYHFPLCGLQAFLLFVGYDRRPNGIGLVLETNWWL